MTTATDSLATALTDVTGACLAGVEYGLLPSDQNQDLSSLAMQLSGEVILRFSNNSELHFTWSGWSGANQDWVLRATSTALCTTPTTNIDASPFAPWPSVAGRPLIEAHILGWEGEPSVVRLKFDEGSVLVGVGSDGWFGSADSLLVRPDQSPFLDFPVPIEVLWSERRGA